MVKRGRKHNSYHKIILVRCMTQFIKDSLQKLNKKILTPNVSVTKLNVSIFRLIFSKFVRRLFTFKGTVLYTS